MNIKITVRNKLPVCGDVAIVCNNSDYTVVWELGEEWSGYDTKTMRTTFSDGTHVDTIFTGTKVNLPVVTVPGRVCIGLYAGDIHTSAPACITAKPSILSCGGAPAKPSEDVYNQLMERMAQLETPDWSQNNPDAKDYVKNRPFYTGDPVETVLLEETSVQFSGGYGELQTPLFLNIGVTYNVTWDGTTYSCVCKEHDAGNVKINCIGNFGMIGKGEDTGEPFFIMLLYAFTSDQSDSHTISVSGPVAPVIKIDPKYIPDELPYLQKRNPVGTGSFALNAATNSTVGDYAFCSGLGCEASGMYSHAEGLTTKATAYYSHAEGLNTVASGNSAHAEGISTIAASNQQHAQGRFNIEDTEGKYAHIVGNGHDVYDRSNAHTLDWSGNAWFSGDVYVGSTSGKDKDAGSKKLATEDYVDGKIPAVTTDDNGKVMQVVGGEWSAEEMPASSNVQSDWNQNDETQPDYVKNRPFYTGAPVETVLLAETTLNVQAQQGGMSILGVSNVDFAFEIGKTYKVSWDGTMYSCVASYFNGSGIGCIGNQHIINNGTGADTGEPFMLGAYSNVLEIYTLDTAASHTVAISRYEPEIVKIDEKYLPDYLLKDPVYYSSNIANWSSDAKQQMYDDVVSGKNVIYIFGDDHIPLKVLTIDNAPFCFSGFYHKSFIFVNEYGTISSAELPDEAVASVLYVDKKAIGMNITGATVGQIAKISAIDANGVPTAWEPVDLPAGGAPSLNFDLIVDHTVTAEDLTVSRLTWTNETIPNLGKYNLFYAAIESDTEFGLTKWVCFYINGYDTAGFSGTSATKCSVVPVACNRYFGRWIGSNVYNAVNSVPFPALIGPCENSKMINTAEDATSIGIGSYNPDFGLVEGMHIRVYAMT